MERLAHVTTQPRHTHNITRLRHFATATAAIAILAAAVLATNLRDAPLASAHPHDDQYDLCTRTPAVTTAILTELRAWGTAQSPADTRYAAASNFGCAAGQTANISAANLLAHTDWNSDADKLQLGSSLTSVKPGDFAGLNLTYLTFWWANITEIPARVFEGLELEDLQFRDLQSLESIHPDAFAGLNVAANRFVLNITGRSKLTAESIPPKVFDPIGDQGFADATKNLQFMTLYGPKLSHINTRWFASFAKTGTLGWEGFALRPDSWDNGDRRGGWGIIDTYYYDDGDGRYTDGTKTTLGEVSIASSTTAKATLGAAISAEIKRYADAKSGSTFTIGAASGTSGILANATTIRNFGWNDGTPADGESPLQVDRTHWGSVDICARTPAVRDAILAELRAEQSAIYGTAANPTAGTYSVTAGFGCTGSSSTQSAVVTKTLLTSHTNWGITNDRLNLSSKSITSLQFHDFRYLDVEEIDLASNPIEKLPDRAFADLTPSRLQFWGAGLREFGSNVLHGIVNAGTIPGSGVVLGLSRNKLTDVGIAHDAFDHWTNITFIGLDGNLIGRVNTRWFQRLVNLGNGASWFGLHFDAGTRTSQNVLLQNPTVAHFYNNTGGYNDTGATEKEDYDPNVTADQNLLKMRIEGKIAAYATATSGVTDNSDLDSGKFRAPIGLGVDPCDRNTAVWKDLMRQFNFIRDDVAEAQGPWRPWHVTQQRLGVGDIRHDRYANITKSQCVVLPAQFVTAATGVAIADQTSPSSTTDVLAIRNDLSNGQHINNFRLDGSDLSTLTAADLANLHAVEKLWMNGSNVENLGATVFAHLPKLTHLNLAGNKIDTADLSGTSNFLSPLDNLVQLNLSDNLLTRFNASWLTSDARSSLRELYIGGNPIVKTDLSGLNVTHLTIDRTSIVELDPAISGMTNLRTFWWWGIRALPLDGASGFVAGLPSGLTLSVPDYSFGNPGDLEGADLDAATVELSLAHNTKLASINTAGGGSQVTYMQLADPCRPTIGDAGGATAWANTYGDLCLTSAQKDAWISSIDDFDGAQHFIIKNGNLSDAQMATLLGKLAAQTTVGGIQFNGNPEAFGPGFSDSALSAFSQLNRLWLLRLRNHDLTYAQANTILRNYQSASRASWTYTLYGNNVNARGGLTRLDLSHNSQLFKKPDTTDPTMMVDVDPEDLHNFLTGVMSTNEGARLHINLRATGLNFDQLRAIVWSIETGSLPTNLWNVETLDLSDNPNVWERRNQAGVYADVPTDEIEALLARLAGVKNLSVGGTGLVTQTMLEAVFDGLNTAPNADKAVDPRDTTTLERLSLFSLTGTNLSNITDVTTPFGQFATRNALQTPQLATLGLGNTSITYAQLEQITDALQTADLLDGITTLNLAGNDDIYTGCTDGGATNPLAALLARYTNLRYLNVSDSSLTFTHFKCVTEGLEPANAIFLNARDNTGLFTGQMADDVAEVLSPFVNTRTNLQNTGLTASQASAIATERAEGQSEEDQRLIERQFAAQNPSGYSAGLTPLPSASEIDVQSGRGSLRVEFTHDPKDSDGNAFTVLRYEYRYRVRPSDTSTDWGTTGTEAWRTASLDLSTTGTKSIDIFGLTPETVYQIQLRATSVARPNMVTLTGGTSVNLPEINSIKPTITEVNMRAGDTVRLEVNIYGLADILDNTLYGKMDSKLYFTWTDNPSGGSFAAPNDQRRVIYTAPALPGTYRVMAEAGPDGICTDHHDTDFGITDADRESCQATFTVRVTRSLSPTEPQAEPVDPAGPIPTKLSDSDDAEYDVFTPVAGGMFSGDGITVTAAKGAVPDRTLVGVRAAVSAEQAPAPTPGARMSISGNLYDILGVSANGQAVSGFKLDEPLSACLPLPTAFRSNISDVVIVERKTDGSYGILSSKLRQTAGGLNVCGGVSSLPATIGVAKLGVVPEPPATPTPEGTVPPETGGAAPSGVLVVLLLLVGLAVLTGIGRMRRIVE